MQLYWLFLFYQQNTKKFTGNLKFIEKTLQKKYPENLTNLARQSFFLMLVNSSLIKGQFNKEVVIKIEVKDNNVDQALRVLKKKLQREGFFRILKIKSNYEKPSERKKRERQENIKRTKKIQRMKRNS